MDLKVSRREMEGDTGCIGENKLVVDHPCQRRDNDSVAQFNHIDLLKVCCGKHDGGWLE